MSDEKVGLEEQQDELYRGMLAVEGEAALENRIKALRIYTEARIVAMELTWKVLRNRLHQTGVDADLLQAYYAAQARATETRSMDLTAEDELHLEHYRVERYLGGGGFVDTAPAQQSAWQTTSYTVEIKSKPEGKEPR